MADSSPLQAARIADTPRRLDICRSAIHHCDFTALAAVTEQDSNLMHAVMMTSSPALFYWEPASLKLMKAVSAWRMAGLPAAYTLDAGPNVHVLCEGSAADQVRERLLAMPEVRQVFTARVGGPARIVSPEVDRPPQQAGKPSTDQL
jgi:diphosphomevalonate decarboxylase